jgi:hypothetical protein
MDHRGGKMSTLLRDVEPKFSSRVLNALELGDITTHEQLMALTFCQIQRWPNLGRHSWRQIDAYRIMHGATSFMPWEPDESGVVQIQYGGLTWVRAETLTTQRRVATIACNKRDEEIDRLQAEIERLRDLIRSLVNGNPNEVTRSVAGTDYTVFDEWRERAKVILGDPEALPDGTLSRSTMRRRAAVSKA